MIRRYSTERSEREFRWGQVGSSSLVALAHGTNDAQKTMGVICLALIANHSISGGDNFHVHVGYPLSTTQVVSGAVAGSGVGRPGAIVNWLVARNIVIGWLLTLPAAAAVGALSYAVIDLLGDSAFGVIVVSIAMVIGAFFLWRANRAKPVEPDETISEHPTFGEARAPEAIAA